VEEHHEAFYVWQYAVKSAWTPATGNTLLHVDSHADMSSPRLRRSMSSLVELSDFCHFTYRELDIGNFILPAVYQGLFDRILWLKHQHSASASGLRQLAICARNQQGTEFITAKSSELPDELAPADVRRFEYSYVLAQHAPAQAEHLVLDIDMDYFCCNDFPELAHREVEITAASYEQFHRNRYHFLRISPGAKVAAVEREGKYWLVYEDLPDRQHGSFSESSIQQRIQEFVRYLAGYASPELIVLCRSVHSGYLPKELHRFVETNLIAALEAHYELEKMFIDDILPDAVTIGMNCEKNQL
jgi:hypothetical protein